MKENKIYRYFYINKNKNIFSSITQLNLKSASEYLHYIELNSLAKETYNEKYIDQRCKTEEKMYNLFIFKGGKPKIKTPYYFTLGKCDEWFYGIKQCFGSAEFLLDEFNEFEISFTYGDSIPTFMDEFDDGKEYRKKIYTFNEIENIIKKYGMPNNWNTYGEKGPENYIEVQIWSNEVISKYNNNNLKVAEEISERIIKANSNIEIEIMYQNSISKYLLEIKNYDEWNWFKTVISEIDEEIFKKDIIHGTEHGIRCALMALILAKKNNFDEIKFKTVIYAAIYHDIGRKYNVRGMSHGEIGSKLIQRVVKNKDKVDFHLLKEAILNHDNNKVIDNDVLILLRDIDSLDYFRLGISIFNCKYLKSRYAKDLIRFSLELNIIFYINKNYIINFIGEE